MKINPLVEVYRRLSALLLKKPYFPSLDTGDLTAMDFYRASRAELDERHTVGELRGSIEGSGALEELMREREWERGRDE